MPNLALSKRLKLDRKLGPLGSALGGAQASPPPPADFTISLTGPSLPANFSLTRASSATYFDASGNLQTAAADTPRFDYDPLNHTLLGLLLEGVQGASNTGVVTNLIRNSTWQGGGVGTFPTNVTFNNNSNGLSASVVAVGTQQNIPTIDVRISGTTSSSAAAILYFEATNNIAQSASSTYGNSVFIELVGGTNANIANISNDVEERNSGGTVLATVAGDNEYDSLPTTATGLMRLGTRAVASAATTAFVVPGLTITPSGSSVAIDITLRIAGPQLELNTYGVTSLIQTSGSTASRSPDVCTITGAAGTALGASNVSVMVGYTPGTQVSAHYRAFINSNGPVGLGADDSAQPNQTISNNGAVLLGNATAFGSGVFPYLSAIAVAPSSRTLANGSASYGGTYAQDTASITLNNRFGCDTSFQSPPNGHFWSVSIWQRTLTPSQLESVTAITNATAAWGDSYTQGVGSSIPYGGAPFGVTKPFLRYGWIGYLWSKASNAMNIFNFGIGGQNSTQIATRMLADTLHVDDNVVIWSGRNDIPPSGGSVPAAVVTNIQNMVAHLGSNQRYLILSVVNFPAEVAGTDKYNSIIGLNALLASTFPGNYLDIRTLLVTASGGVNDAPNQTWMFENIAGSGTYDHPNDNAYRYVGEQVYQWGLTNGWLFGAGPTPSWQLAGSTVDLDFANTRYFGGTLSGLITFTRSSSKTNLRPSSPSGFAYSTFSSNVPAITPGLGILIESSRTNLFLNSTAPTTQTITLPATGSYTLWVNGSGSAAIAAGTATITGAGTATNGTSVTINCTVVGTVTVTVTGSLNAAQLESGTFGTSLVVTSGTTASRSDDVALAASSLLTTFKGSAASIVVRSGPSPNLGAFPRIVGSQVTAQGLPFVGSGGTSLGIYNGSSSLTATGGNIATASTKIGVSWSGAGRSAVGNNGTVATDANVQVSDTAYYIGSLGAGNIFFEGYVSRLTVWNSKLADATLKGLTQ